LAISRLTIPSRFESAVLEAVEIRRAGLHELVDPLGNPRDVWTGPKNGYWTNGTGRVINSDVSPSAGWQRMVVADPH
jgi:hypothetical protein